MTLDRTKLHQGYKSYLSKAEESSGKPYDHMALVLSKSGLKTHGELRSHLMERLGLGHGHANAVVHIWREFDGGSTIVEPAKKAAAKKAPAKKAAKPKAKK